MTLTSFCQITSNTLAYSRDICIPATSITTRVAGHIQKQTEDISI